MKALIIALILLAYPVAAEIDVVTYPTGGGFSIYTGTNDYTLCQCEIKADTITVTNTGGYANRYQVSYTNPDLVTISDTSFELLPGETEHVYLYVHAPCDKELTEEFSIFITDIHGEKIAVEKTVTVGRCQNLEASLITPSNVINPCEETTYEVLIANTGAFTETYDVSFGGDYEDYFDPAYQAIIIPAGMQGYVLSTLHLSCSQYGNFELPFTVEARQNNLEAELVHNLKVRQAYNFSVGVGDVQLCARQTSRMPVWLSNDGVVPNTYNISFSGPDFISLTNETVTLSQDSGASITLIASPTADQVGDHTVTLTIKSEWGDMVSTNEFNVSVNECYGISVNIDAQEDIYQCAGEATVPVVVTNTGSFGANVWMNASVPLTNYSYYLEAGESQVFPLTITGPINEKVYMYAGVVDIVAEDSIGIGLLADQECYQINLADDSLDARYHHEKTTLVVRNVGLKEALYEFTYIGPTFLALNDTSLYATLAPEDETHLELFFYQDGSDAQKTYDGILQAKAYLGDKAFNYEFPFTLTLHEKPFYEVWYQYLSTHPCQLVSIILLIIIAVFIILLLVRHSPVKHSGVLLLVLLALWALAVVVAYSIYGLPPSMQEPVAPSGDPSVMRFAEDTQLTLNLSQYFVDPDQDDLLYEVSEIDNFSVDVEDGVAVFTPQKDWSGSRRFRITAFDNKGGMTESPRMSLEVVDVPDYTLCLLYNRYCLSANLLLLLVVAVLIYFLAIRTESAPEPELPKMPAKKKTTKKTVKKKAKRGRPKKK